MTSSRPSFFSPVICLLVGAALWGLTWYPLRLLEAGGLQGLWLTLIAYATILIVTLPVTLRCLREFTQAPVLLTLLILASGWTNVAFILAILEGNILRVMMLFYLSPLWATLMGWLFLKEHISGTAIGSLILALSGAFLMLWNPEMGSPWPQGKADLWAISAGLAFAVANVVIRQTSTISLSTKMSTVWVGVVFLSSGLILLEGSGIPDAAAPVFLGAAALGIFVIFAMTWMVQYGVSHMPVHRSSVILLFELVVAGISQQLLTDEVVTPLEWLGGALIVVGAYLSARIPHDVE